MDTQSKPHVVIIGGGFGGLNAARALAGKPVTVTLVDRRNHHLFQPLLYQVATAALSPADIAYPIRGIVRRDTNIRVWLAEVRSIDVESREVVLSDGRLSYDYLIVAAGAQNFYFGHDEWEMNAPGLKSLENALEIRRRVLLAFEQAERETDPELRHALLTFVIIGAGPTGVELAGAIAEISRRVIAMEFRAIDPRQARIILIEGGGRILPTFSDHLSARAHKWLIKLGVKVRTSTMVSAVESEAVYLGDGERIDAHTALWAAGVRVSPLAKDLGVPLDHGGRALVEPDLSIPGHPEVFVIGDLAAFVHQDGRALPGLAPVAAQQGRHAARNIVLTTRGKPRRPFRYVDKGNLATIGRAYAVVDIRGLRVSGFIAWILWLVVHIFFLIGFRSRLSVMFQWGWSYFTDQHGARLITGPIEQTRMHKSQLGQQVA